MDTPHGVCGWQARAKTSRRGYYCVALEQPRFEENVGAVLRACGVYEANLVVLRQGGRLALGGQDTLRSHRHIPVVIVEDIFTALPINCTPVAVDFIEGACPLPHYVHPERAFYIFGPENGTLAPNIVKACHHAIYVPTQISMNLAASVNVVLYDRAAKRNEWPQRLQRGERNKAKGAPDRT
ncbi:MAG: TrmH family RNA methyltransferase [Alphaproteobacteria bacterium GM7ARS4]|nr:TrmH family RNA methyltransferase [Alphaproteobacteria bacterium GM7ARS4]